MLSTEQTAVNAACLAACVAAGLEPDVVQGAILISGETQARVSVTVPRSLLFGIANELFNRFNDEGFISICWRISDEEVWTDTHYQESTAALVEFRNYNPRGWQHFELLLTEAAE